MQALSERLRAWWMCWGGKDSAGPSRGSQSSGGHWPAENRTQAACCYADATGGRHGSPSQFRLWERQPGQESSWGCLVVLHNQLPARLPEPPFPAFPPFSPAKVKPRRDLPALGLGILAGVSVTQPGQGPDFPYTLFHLRMLDMDSRPPTGVQPEKEEPCRVGDSWFQDFLKVQSRKNQRSHQNSFPSPDSPLTV